MIIYIVTSMAPPDGLEALIDAVQVTQQDALDDAAQRLWETVVDIAKQCKDDRSLIDSVQHSCKRATQIWVCDQRCTSTKTKCHALRLGRCCDYW